MHQRARPRIESATRISITELRARGIIAPGTTWEGSLSWSVLGCNSVFTVILSANTGNTDGNLEMRYRPVLGNSLVTLTIKLTTTRPHFGGARWWLTCPLTGRLATHLYLFADSDTFCHRTAVDRPNYPTQRMTALQRVIHRRATLRQRLRVGWEMMNKPGGMRRTTYARLLALDLNLQAKENELIVRKVLGSLLDRPV